MRELILLRHAHAEPALAGQSDLDRPLSPDGRAEAGAAARWLAEQRLVPDCVLCSPARRTRETLETVLSVLGYVDQRLEQRIYEATPGTLASLLDGHREQDPRRGRRIQEGTPAARASRLDGQRAQDRRLLVGHNPGLERLVALLHSGASSEFRGMPPAGIAALEFASEGPVESGGATLSAFW